MARAVFDTPAAIGPVVWSAGWSERVDLVPRVIMSLVPASIVTYGLARLAGHHDLTTIDEIMWLLACVGAFVLLGPPQHCHCVGERGFSRSTRRFGFAVSRRVVRFDDVDDVDLQYTRIVSDSVHRLYARTKVTVSWLDREGELVHELVGHVIEPSQSAKVEYDPDAPLDADMQPFAGNIDEAALGFAAVRAFDAFKDQRPRSEYR